MVTIVNMEKVVPQEFIEWISENMKERNWSLRQTARAAGVSHSSISLVMNGDKPSYDLVAALAKAFQSPPEIAFQKAGLLPPSTQDADEKEIIFLFSQLPPERQQDVLKMVRALLEK